mgnify:CR=1 FL=1|jgi:uncharacterized membrane protein YcaP (DUF421 family)
MELVLRATAIYWLLWIVVRGVGKRSLAEISPLQLILLVVYGDIVQQGVTQEDMSVTGAAIVVTTMTAWAVLGAWLGQRFDPVARVLSGVPVVIVLDGEPVEDSLAAEAIDLDDVKEAAREEGIADLRDVDVAILNPDGKLAFIRRS